MVGVPEDDDSDSSLASALLVDQSSDDKRPGSGRRHVRWLENEDLELSLRALGVFVEAFVPRVHEIPQALALVAFDLGCAHA
jgi:hypothetical protein